MKEPTSGSRPIDTYLHIVNILQCLYIADCNMLYVSFAEYHLFYRDLHIVNILQCLYIVIILQYIEKIFVEARHATLHDPVYRAKATQ